MHHQDNAIPELISALHRACQRVLGHAFGKVLVAASQPRRGSETAEVKDGRSLMNHRWSAMVASASCFQDTGGESSEHCLEPKPAPTNSAIPSQKGGGASGQTPRTPEAVCGVGCPSTPEDEEKAMSWPKV